ncbi:unnamed protein product [Urochloa humidicola]
MPLVIPPSTTERLLVHSFSRRSYPLTISLLQQVPSSQRLRLPASVAGLCPRCTAPPPPFPPCRCSLPSPPRRHPFLPPAAQRRRLPCPPCRADAHPPAPNNARQQCRKADARSSPPRCAPSPDPMPLVQEENRERREREGRRKVEQLTCYISIVIL